MKFLDHGKTISLLGEPYQISFESLRFVKSNVVLNEAYLSVYISELKKQTHRSVLYNWLRSYAKKTIPDRVDFFAEKHGFVYNELRIRDQQTRWGSCSSKKNLNFNWKLILVQPEEMDYVIIHELAHLKQMNHSAKFWAIVDSIMPEYDRVRKTLREKEKNYI